MEEIQLPLRYTLNLICPKEIQDEDFKKFTSELGPLLQVIKHQNEKDLKDWIYKIPGLKNIGIESAKLIKEITNMDIELKENEEGKVNMYKSMPSVCYGFDYALNQARDDGQRKGFDDGQKKE